jgi:hypothetical protein
LSFVPVGPLDEVVLVDVEVLVLEAEVLDGEAPSARELKSLWLITNGVSVSRHASDMI